MFALTQFLNLLYWALFAFGFFAVCEVFYLVKFAFSFDRVAVNVLDAVICACLAVAVIAFARAFFFGAVYYYSVMGFLAGAYAERRTLHKMFAKFVQSVYNIVAGVPKKIKNYFGARKGTPKE